MASEEKYFRGALIGAMLAYMGRYGSAWPFSLSKNMRNAMRLFEEHLIRIERSPACLGIDELRNKQLLKTKYYVYGAFLGVMSSHPILHLRAPSDAVLSAVLAKTSLMTSIKLLDNINDRFHEQQEAASSQFMYGNALVNESFKLRDSDQWISKAENTAYALARLCHDILMRELRQSRQQTLLNLFARDVKEYLAGQLNSFQQKAEVYSKKPLTLKEYVDKVIVKGCGKPWLDIDACFFMTKRDPPTESDWAVIRLLGEGADLIFKALLFYDDVTDLEQDLSEGIINTCMMLGMELGRVSKSELYGSTHELVSKLTSSQTTQDAIKIGDIFLLQAAKRFRQIKLYTNDVAADALVFSCRALRMFLLRKLILRKLSPHGVKALMASFNSFRSLNAAVSGDVLSLALSLLPKKYSEIQSEETVQHQILRTHSS